MHRFTLLGICCIAIFCCHHGLAMAALPVSAPPNDDSVNGEIKQVTLYRNRAMVTREIATTVDSGTQSIIVGNLPSQLVPQSVFAEATAPTVVRAIRVTRMQGEQPNSNEVEALEKELSELIRVRSQLLMEQGVIKQNEQLLSQMISFAAASGKSDLERGVLDANALKEMTTFTMEQRKTLAEQMLDVKNRLEDVDRQIDQTEARQSAVDSFEPSKFQAEVFVDVEEGQEAKIRLSYQVDGCSWSPLYSIHGDSADSTVRLQYSAVVQQTTGESWDNVQLKLSTASPLADATGPQLTPLRISSIFDGDESMEDPFGDGQQETDNSEALARLTNMLRNQQQQTDFSELSEASRRRDLQLNGFAGQLQEFELQAQSRTLRSQAIDANDNLSSQSYSIESPVSLNSRPEQQLIQILDASLEGEMYHVATPLLSSFVYRQAKVTNSFKVGLLSGNASVYLDEQFVGLAQLPSTAQGQKLTLGFGIDPQVRTRRELLDKSDALKGGNRQIQLDYRLVIANFKDQEVDIRLVDRIPVPTQSDRLTVALEKSDHEVSEDPLYLRTLRNSGILRWDIKVPGKRIGSEAYDVHYSSTLEFDRNQTLSAQLSLDAITADYEESLNRGRGGGGFGGGGIF